MIYGVRKVSDGVSNVPYCARNLSEGVRKVSDGVTNEYDGVKKRSNIVRKMKILLSKV